MTVNLRLVSVQTGAVVQSVTTTKQIYSTLVQASVFKFVALDSLLEIETGFTRNSPPQLAVREAIELGVYSLVMEGARRGIWEFKDKVAGARTLSKYLAHTGQPSASDAGAKRTSSAPEERVRQVATAPAEERKEPVKLSQAAPKADAKPSVGKKYARNQVDDTKQSSPQVRTVALKPTIPVAEASKSDTVPSKSDSPPEAPSKRDRKFSWASDEAAPLQPAAQPESNELAQPAPVANASSSTTANPTQKPDRSFKWAGHEKTPSEPIVENKDEHVVEVIAYEGAPRLKIRLQQGLAENMATLALTSSNR